ncbi:MAG: MurT ligase domain-containing protein [Actinomycetota bacterium]|nr:MurT ligase domain-containing protein [Actinomycetota bacterium]
MGGRLAGAASRVTGRGGGGTLPGRVLLTVAPDAVAQLGAGLPAALVSGTNGKTTTTRLLFAGLSGPDRQVLSNHDGANLHTGLATTLARRLREPFDAAVLEVDELALPAAVSALVPAVVVLLNLTRDQLDRVSEVARHVPRWRDALAGAPGTHVVANADDPLVVAAVLGARPGSEGVTWVAAGQRWLADAVFCPICACAWAPPAGDGGFTCSSCSFRRPLPDARVVGNRLVCGDGRSFEVRLALPGQANVGNACLAALAAGRLGVPLETALERMSAITDVAGRYRVVEVDGRAARLLLAKNPAGWSEALAQLDGSEEPCVVAINAQAADGTDPSWLWDVPFEQLRGRRVVAAGERADDVAVRLYYAEVDCRTVPDLVEAIRACPPGSCNVLANYTAFAQLRRRIERDSGRSGR